ncbi:MAG: nitrate reductase gamma subunit [Planctomycetota bacterium]|jgi:nitrate reductase gamma subunit
MPSENFMADLDNILFVIFPYLAFVVFFLVTIQRYRSQTFTYSSLSSQFLENKHHFWGMVPFHYGVLVIIVGHIIGFLIPRSVIAWNATPLRLYVLEVTALIFGILTLVGFINVIVRRFRSLSVRRVTTAADWTLYAILLAQFASGVHIAIFSRWGSAWFASNASPYLWSLVKFAPDLSYIAPLPWMVKAHMVSAFALIALFPFTRLVHILVVPNPYLWRRTQVVRWYGNPKKRLER